MRVRRSNKLTYPKSLASALPMVAAGLVLAASSTAATEVNLATDNSGTINGALFEWTAQQPTGTGVIDPFLRLQGNANGSVEEGYNTSGRPFALDQKEPLNFTHDVKLSDLGSGVTVNGQQYYEFLLDVNEPGGKKSDISLDSLQLYTSPTGSKTVSDVSQLGTLRYDSGKGNFILLDASRNSGSGSGDMLAFIPKSDFAGASPNDFVYLYSKFGLNAKAEAGFEEWAAVVANNGGNSTGGTPPANNGGGNTTPPANNGGGNTQPPANQGGSVTPPANNGGGSTTPPSGNNNQGGNTQPPASTGGGTTTPPANIGGSTPPGGENQGGSQVGNNTPPAGTEGSNTPPAGTEGSSTPPSNQSNTGTGTVTPPSNNSGGGPSAVPEPSTYVMLSSFLALTVYLKRRVSR